MSCPTCGSEGADRTATATRARESRIGRRPPEPERWLLVGNPNAGKTTLFNRLTGGRREVANWPGSTVEKGTGRLAAGGRPVELVDLPGIYSLDALSEEESIARQAVLEEAGRAVVLVVADAARLERSLSLVLEVAEVAPAVVVALNMLDVARAEGQEVDPAALSEALGLPVVPVVARSGEGVGELVAQAEAAWRELRRAGDGAAGGAAGGRSRARGEAGEELSDEEAFARAEERFLRVQEVAAAAVRRVRREPTPSERIDRWALHPVLGYVLLAAVLGGVFEIAFVASAPLSEAVGEALGRLGDWAARGVAAAGGPTWLGGFLRDGLLGGVGAVLAFVPYLVLFYILQEALQDSGYMARAAVLVDRLMEAIGLHGKGFFAMATAYGCNVPALTATRVLENARDRIAHELVIPFLPCNARLGVLLVLTAAFFPGARGALAFGGLMLLSLGVVAAVTALLRRTLLPREEAPLVMELPPYHVPTWRNAVLPALHHVRAFVSRIWRYLLWATLALWALSALPAGAAPAQSYAARLAGAVGILGAPWHLDGRLVLALLSGFVAKETTLGTLAILYGSAGAGGPVAALASSVSPLVGFAFLAMYMLYTPCLATVVTLREETGSARWAAFSVLLSLGVAGLTGALIEQLGALAGWAL
ncbi:MAG: ferrous iron transport protein B [Bacillota bacterium]|nr:ferrous iron transport protein B [Bacillota bacterium]